MGNSSQNEYIDAYIHPRLGPIKRLQSQQSDQYIEYCVGIENEKLLQEWESDFKTLKDMGAAEFLLLPLSFSFDKTAMCGTGGNIDIKFEDFMFSLSPQIKNRSDIRRPFREEQIWYLLYSLANVGAMMQKLGMKIGDVRPENILLNQDGQFKMISSYSWPNNPDNNQLVMEDPSARVFLSPEQCQFYNKKKGLAYPDGLDFNSCEVFSMGMTVLEAGTLKDCYDGLYERNKEWKFNQFKVRDFTNILAERYSKELAMIIQEMLKPCPERRIKCSTIVEALSPYKSQITNIEPIEVDRTMLWEVIQAAGKQRSARLPGKSSLSGPNNLYNQPPLKKTQSFDNRRELQEQANSGAFQQNSPRNMASSMIGHKHTPTHSVQLNPVNQTPGMNGLSYSFQNPHMIAQGQQYQSSSIHSTNSTTSAIHPQSGNTHIQQYYTVHQIPIYHQPSAYYQPIDSVISQAPLPQYQTYHPKTEFLQTTRIIYQTMDPPVQMQQPLSYIGGNPGAFSKRSQASN